MHTLHYIMQCHAPCDKTVTLFILFFRHWRVMKMWCATLWSQAPCRSTQAPSRRLWRS